MARYNAFLSYRRKADGKIAATLQSALHRFAKPWYRLRAVHIFRDQTSLSVRPSLWWTIQRAIASSEYFILLASPESAEAYWVKREVAYWLETNSADRLLLVITAGDIHWSRSTSRFDRERTTCLPTELIDVVEAEPLWVDLRWARDDQALSPRDPRFQDAVAMLAATLRGQPKDDLIGEDVREHRRARRLAAVATFAIGVLAVAAMVAGQVAFTQRDIAVREATVALARALAAAVQHEVDEAQHERATLLALQAHMLNSRVRGDASVQVDQALRTALGGATYSRQLPGTADMVWSVAFDPGGRLLAAGNEEGTVRVWSLDDLGAEAALLQSPGTARSVAFSPDGAFLVVAGDEGIRYWDVAEDRWQGHDLRSAGRYARLAFAPGGELLAANSSGGLTIWRRLATGASPMVFALPSGKSVDVVRFLTRDRIAIAVGSNRRVDLRYVPISHVLEGRAVDVDRSTPVFSSIWPEAYAVSEDGETVAVLAAGVLRLARLDTDVVTTLARDVGTPGRLALTSDGRYLVAADLIVRNRFGEAEARVWDLADKGSVRRLGGGGRGIMAISVDEVGGRIAIGTMEGNVRLWELHGGPGAPRELVLTEYGPASVAMTANGDWLAAVGGLSVVGPDQGKVWIWNIRIPGDPASIRQRWYPRSVVIAGGAVIWAASQGDRGRIWRVPLDSVRPGARLTPEPLRDVAPGATLAASKDGRILAVGLPAHVELRDADSGQILRTILLSDGKNPNVDEVDPEALSAMTLSSDGRLLAAANFGGTIRIWDWAQDSLPPVTLTGDTDAPSTLAFDPSASVLAAGSGAQVTLWSLAARSAQRLPQESPVSSVAISSDGASLLVGNLDGAIRIHSMDDLDMPQVLRGHEEAPISGAAFTHDDRWFVTAAPFRERPGGSLLIWPSANTLAELGCEYVTRNLTLSEWATFVGNALPYEDTCASR
jgi:WD40 repeat protein